MQSESQLCGWSCGFQPKWLQAFANTRSFILVYGFLGTVQSAAFIYFVVTLSTLERRFQIPSRTMGWFSLSLLSTLCVLSQHISLALSLSLPICLIRFGTER